MFFLKGGNNKTNPVSMIYHTTENKISNVSQMENSRKKKTVKKYQIREIIQ